MSVAAIVTASAIVIALLVPSSYRSTATILIQEREIPSGPARTAAIKFAGQRVQAVAREVMTPSVLLSLASKYKLYRSPGGDENDGEVLDRMRKAIRLQPVNMHIADRSGSKATAAIMFQVSYDSRSPRNAQGVARELAALYLTRNVRTPQERPAQVFLSEEAERITAQMTELETRLAAFDARNRGRLPKDTDSDVAALGRASSDLTRIDQDLARAQARKIGLEARIAEARALTRAAEHSNRAKVRDVAGNLPAAPEGALRSADAWAREGGPPSPGETASVLALRAQLSSAVRDIDALEQARAAAEARIRSLEARLARDPGVEKDYIDLQRDHENLLAHYREIKARQLAEEATESLAKDRDRARFSLVDSPRLPERPVSPNRPLLVLMGLAISAVGGVGWGFLLDAFDRSVKGLRDLQRLSSVPLLGSVPYVESRGDASAVLRCVLDRSANSG